LAGSFVCGTGAISPSAEPSGNARPTEKKNGELWVGLQSIVLKTVVRLQDELGNQDNRRMPTVGIMFQTIPS
jgi:hypothetical protein